MIFDENSTPMVCEESTRPATRIVSNGPPSPPLISRADVHSPLTNRCSKQDLWDHSDQPVSRQTDRQTAEPDTYFPHPLGPSSIIFAR